MIHFVYLSIIVGMVFLLALYYKQQEKDEAVIIMLTDELHAADQENKALEQGFVEITDAYETDSLQYESTIEELREKLDAQVVVSESYQSRYNEARASKIYLIEENLGIRRQLDIAQVIISEHDANCLPHLVLSSMEEKDTPLPMD